MIILEKDYDGESLPDINRDIHECFDSRYNPTVDSIELDEYGLLKGNFKLTINWSKKYIPQPEINRVEVIDNTGRAYVNMHVGSCELSYQDGGKTLKIFID